MKSNPRIPQWTVSIRLSSREREAILETLDHCHQDVLDIINRFAPREPLVLPVDEMSNLAGALTDISFHDSTPATRKLMKIAKRMDQLIGQELGFRQKPQPLLPKSRNGELDARNSTELTAQTPNKHRGVYLVPDFTALMRAFR